MVVQKRINFGWRRRQPGEIERQTANQRGSLGFRRRAEAFALKPIQNKIVDTRPILVLNNGTGGALWREIPVSAAPTWRLLDSTSNQLDLPSVSFRPEEAGHTVSQHCRP